MDCASSKENWKATHNLETMDTIYHVLFTLLIMQVNENLSNENFK